MQLQNAQVLITGGSLGIGKATARLLIENGARVAITGRNEARLHRAAEDIGAYPILADVAKEDDVKRTYEEYFKQFDRLDVLVNNAGIGRHAPLESISVEDFRAVMDVNVIGAAMMAKYAAKEFMKQKSGNIINIGSTSGLKGYANGTIYSASKFALRSMTESWRAELRKYNVRVMLVNPSEVTTAFGNPGGEERPEQDNKLRSLEIAHSIKSALEMDDRGFITDLTVFATNPW